MNYEADGCCPICGSESAVPKWQAWDALCETPPKVKAELERLRLVEEAARNLLQHGAHPPDENTVIYMVKQDSIRALEQAVGCKLQPFFDTRECGSPSQS